MFASVVCSNIGFVAAGADPGILIFYSVLQFVVGAIAGFVILYYGYRGVAGDLASNSRIYLIAQGILTILMGLFSGLPSGNLHGFGGINGSKKDLMPQPGYLVLCIIEGVMWIGCAVFSLYCMWSVYKYPGHDRANRIATVEQARKERMEEVQHKKEKRKKKKEKVAESEAAAGGVLEPV